MKIIVIRVRTSFAESSLEVAKVTRHSIRHGRCNALEPETNIHAFNPNLLGYLFLQLSILYMHRQTLITLHKQTVSPVLISIPG